MTCSDSKLAQVPLAVQQDAVTIGTASPIPLCYTLGNNLTNFWAMM